MERRGTHDFASRLSHDTYSTRPNFFGIADYTMTISVSAHREIRCIVFAARVLTLSNNRDQILLKKKGTYIVAGTLTLTLTLGGAIGSP